MAISPSSPPPPINVIAPNPGLRAGGTAQLLGLAGSQPTLLTIDPPWTPLFKGQKVELTCGDHNVSVSTTWYKNGKQWKSTASNRVQLTLSDEVKHQFRCRNRGFELSPAINVNISNAWLVLQVPARAVLEGDALSLRCRAWKDTKLSGVQFSRGKVLLQDRRGDELLLSPAKQEHSGRYHCSGKMHSVIPRWVESSPSELVVQELFSVPELSVEGPQERPEGSALTLLCATRHNALRPHLTLQHLFYQDGLQVAGPQLSPQHQVPALLLSHSGSYSCQVQTESGSVQKRSAQRIITVRRVPVAGVSVQAEPPGAQVVEGDRLVLSCAAAEGTGPLSFSWHRQGRTRPLGTGPRYEIAVTQLGDSDHYHCTATNGISTAESPQLHVTVVAPVSNATIMVAGTEAVGAELVRTAGEGLALSCAVQAGTAPVAFTWLRDGRELGTGPTWHLEALGPEHAGTYQCVATNRVGPQRVFRAHSPTLLIVVTLWGRQRVQALAVGLSVSLLVLLAATAALGWHFWRRRHPAATKSQHRDPTAPPARPAPPVLSTDPSEPEHSNVLLGTPSAGDVLYSTVTITEQRGGASPSPCGLAAPQEPPITYAALPGPQGLQRLPSDSYENTPCA
ncbi:Fc receptor-like protein 3 [Numida meleagris]|uniref:Fc receptor-like protein 3 n=1 Tax=Numida meleagris TaxID=8996 RepID=UPI000B3E3518|nr:Fc receptor-like protein 3 [Numida meleagris]